MLATRDDEMLVRKCACHAMNGMGSNIWEKIPAPHLTPLAPAPYTPISYQVPHSLQEGAGTVLAPPSTTPIPVKKPFNWDQLSVNMSSLIGTYGTVTGSRADRKLMQEQAARSERMSARSIQSSDAKAKAAAMAAQAGAGQPKQGMSTGTKVAIGAGVTVAAIAAYAALS